jgi:hypothetical protein
MRVGSVVVRERQDQTRPSLVSFEFTWALAGACVVQLGVQVWLLDLLHPYVQVKLVWLALLLLDGVYKLRCVHPFLWFIRLSYVASSPHYYSQSCLLRGWACQGVKCHGGGEGTDAAGFGR